MISKDSHDPVTSAQRMVTQIKGDFSVLMNRCQTDLQTQCYQLYVVLLEGHIEAYCQTCIYELDIIKYDLHAGLWHLYWENAVKIEKSQKADV